MQEKTSLHSGIFTYQSTGVFRLINVIFISCVNSGHGGAMYLDCPSADIFCGVTTFDRCVSGNHGGGIFINNCKNLQQTKSCYYQSKALYCAAYVTISTSINAKNEINLTDETTYHLSGAGSGSFGRELSIWSQCNCSYTPSSTYFAGHGSVTFYSGELSTFSHICHLQGPAIYGLYVMKADVIVQIRKINFVNCTATVGWFEFRASRASLNILECVFAQVQNKPVTRNLEGGTGSVSFFNCVLSSQYDPLYHSSLMYSQNSFSVEDPVQIQLQLFNTIHCWTFSLHYENTIRPLTPSNIFLFGYFLIFS